MPFHILHVDDDPDIREIAQISLGLDPNFSVTSCASADEALAMVADEIPDLILCDVMMPGMDGPAMLACLRKSSHTARIPIVFMTARAKAQNVEEFKELGALGVISKPFDPMTLAAVVLRHLSSARLTATESEFRATAYPNSAR